MIDICVIGLGGEDSHRSDSPLATVLTFILAAIGAFYAHALDRSGKVQITAVCRYVLESIAGWPAGLPQSRSFRSNYSTLQGMQPVDIIP